MKKYRKYHFPLGTDYLIFEGEGVGQLRKKILALEKQEEKTLTHARAEKILCKSRLLLEFLQRVMKRKKFLQILVLKKTSY